MVGSADAESLTNGVAIIGCGYVGLVTAACLASFGRDVACYDISSERLAALRRGAPPFAEPGLPELMTTTMAQKRLHFVNSAEEAVRHRKFVMICVDTPLSGEGIFDLTKVMSAIASVGRALSPGSIVVIKSTVPPGTCTSVAARLAEVRSADDVHVASNPEFLSETTAVRDFLHPSRVVIGAESEGVLDDLERLYRPVDAPVMRVRTTSAEVIKLAANAFLATRVSFINEIESVCDVVGAAIDEVRRGVGADPRIGLDFLRPGLGFGGGCLPKDLAGLIAAARAAGGEPRLLEAVRLVNDRRTDEIADRLDAFVDGLRGRRIGIEGLAYKTGSDDVRDSRAVHLAEVLIARSGEVHAWDPNAIVVTRVRGLLPGVHFCASRQELHTHTVAVIRSSDGSITSTA